MLSLAKQVQDNKFNLLEATYVPSNLETEAISAAHVCNGLLTFLRAQGGRSMIKELPLQALVPA